MLRLINNAFKKVGKEDWITGNMRRYFFILQNVLGSITSMTETVNKVALGKKKKLHLEKKSRRSEHTDSTVLPQLGISCWFVQAPNGTYGILCLEGSTPTS